MTSFITLVAFLLSILFPQNAAFFGQNFSSASSSFALIDNTHVFHSGSASSVTTPNFPTHNPTSGQLIVVFETPDAGGQSANTCVTPTDTLTTSYSLASSVSGGTTQGQPECLYYGITGSGGANAVTCKWSLNAVSQDCHAILFSWPAGAAFDGSCTGSNASSTNPVCSSALSPAPSVNGELLIAGLAFNAGTLGTGTNYTFVNMSADNTEYWIQPTAAANTPSYTNATSTSWTLVAASFKP